MTGIFVDKAAIENLKINTQSNMVLENFISLIADWLVDWLVDWLSNWLICEHDAQHKKYIIFYSMWQGGDWWFVDSW